MKRGSGSHEARIRWPAPGLENIWKFQVRPRTAHHLGARPGQAHAQTHAQAYPSRHNLHLCIISDVPKEKKINFNGKVIILLVCEAPYRSVHLFDQSHT